MNTELNIKTVAAGETVPGVQICPFGRFRGEKSDQVCDRAAFEQLIADWQANGAKEILMDFEHQSEVDKIDSDTKAAAWISNLAIDDDLGLVGDFKFTDKGAEAVSNRRLRFLSATWFTDQDGRPKHMTSVALTNKPNIPVAPILNKEFRESCFVDRGSCGPHANHEPRTTNNEGTKMDIEKIKQEGRAPEDAEQGSGSAGRREYGAAAQQGDRRIPHRPRLRLPDGVGRVPRVEPRTFRLSQASVNTTFHVRRKNPSGCWGFASRSSLHFRLCRFGDAG